MSATTFFRKILIANRGEIAVRIMRTARRMGYRTVAVFSTADADAPHVHLADEAVHIGPPEPAASYLRIEAILAAARSAGADAVHPGYGFLAENGDFADACTAAGLTFIGPSGQAIRQMGNKARARALMLDAGVPCVPGYQGEDQSAARLASEAERLGYPVMIKASEGGGGRGMRVVAAPAQFGPLLESARAEARSAFGSADVILERAITQPRHIEIQIVADRQGHVIHLGERDCSVQRRHQKLIEEAPSPAVSAGLRARMGAVAVMAARTIHYESLGTVEFLLDGNGQFYFMEMNTRLQVEHPVTEAITGLDLVELQLRIAAGQPLPLRQDDVVLRGHAIEVRLCAEDPARGFMPDSGTLAAWEPAREVRVEHALAEAGAIPPFYDPMFAKLIAHGQDRHEAIRRVASGLEDTVALGLKTNKAFLGRCVTHPEFLAGRVTTAFLDAHLPALLEVDTNARQRALAIGAALMLATGSGRPAALRDASAPIRLQLRLDGDETDSVVMLAPAATAGHPVMAGHPVATSHEVTAGYAITAGDRVHVIQVLQARAGQARLICDGLLERVAFVREGARLLFQSRGNAHELLDAVRARHWNSATRPPGDHGLVASTGGKVTAILVTPGQHVQADDPLLVLEAMKMEHIYSAPVSGAVVVLHAEVGQHIHAGQLLAEISAAAPARPG